MDKATAAIVSAILHVARKSGTLITNDPTLTGRAILAACTHWEAHERALVIPELKDAPPWPAYELKVLHLGRALDLLMRKLGCWKGRGPVLDTAAKIVATVRFGRGRQSFVATLGEHGQGAYGGELAALLSEEGMAGYAIKALHRGGSGEYVMEVQAAAEGDRPWVQSAARMYAAEFGGKTSRQTDRKSRRAPRISSGKPL